MPEGEREGFQVVGVRALPVGWMGGERFGGWGGKGVAGGANPYDFNYHTLLKTTHEPA